MGFEGPTAWARHAAGRPLAPEARLRRGTRRTLILAASLILGFFALAVLLKVGGAVVGKGEIAVETRVKTIVHPFGGVLSALYVHDGDRVKEGAVLLRLDTNVSSVGASQASEGVDQLEAHRARLEAEREGRGGVTFPPELARRADPEAMLAMARERRLFDLKRREQAGQVALLQERVSQAEQEIRSYRSQIDASRRESVLIQPELEGIRSLYARQLVTITRRNQLERTAVELEGSRAALEASVAQSRAHISEIRAQMLSLEQTARADAATELAQVMTQLGEQQVRRATASDTLSRSTVRAPQSGVVDKLAYATIGSAVPAGQAILQIVPDADRMIVEGEIQPTDVHQVHVGQSVRIRFTAMDRQISPEVPGTLIFVSPEAVEDSRTGLRHYRVRVRPDGERLARDLHVKLVSGMPVEIFIETGPRSILSYMLKPLGDQMSHAFRAE